MAEKEVAGLLLMLNIDTAKIGVLLSSIPGTLFERYLPACWNTAVLRCAMPCRRLWLLLRVAGWFGKGKSATKF